MSLRLSSVGRRNAVVSYRHVVVVPRTMAHESRGTPLRVPPPLHHLPPRRLLQQQQQQQLRLLSTTSNNKHNNNHGEDSSSLSPYLMRRQQLQKEIEALPEHQASLRLLSFLQSQIETNNKKTTDTTCIQSATTNTPPSISSSSSSSSRKPHHQQQQHRLLVTAMLATFCLHVESRIAAMAGFGFYTIGPCGEEALAAAACALQKQDSVALHYRHLSINLARQMMMMLMSYYDSDSTDHPEAEEDDDKDYAVLLQQLLLDRARGYTISKHDPVTGGVHCSIGSDPALYSSWSNNPAAGDFIVTSTLASQCPSAVGRALAYSLIKKESTTTTTTTTTTAAAAAAATSKKQQQDHRPISFVTVGDGSVHNHHFWSAFHLARHAKHQHIKCPVLFGISDNGLSISYKTGGYVNTLFGHDALIPVFGANGADLMDVWEQTKKAAAYCRQHAAPAVIIYHNLVRRFGHAATDRQTAYLSQEQIVSMTEQRILEDTLQQAVDVYGVDTYEKWYRHLQNLQQWTLDAFVVASQEDKVSRQDMLDRVSATGAMKTTTTGTTSTKISSNDGESSLSSSPSPSCTDNVIAIKHQQQQQQQQLGRKDVMRKHMTRVLTEVMQQNESIVYLGEDVKHGGYYVVTEGLVSSFPYRILDFPPDETSLLGAALGFSQAGLLPIVEIPYAKYLDCGADMFYEIAIQYWLSAGKRGAGMVIRLQGFDRGLFGGSFHTSNSLPHMPPGVDVVCYSNGHDYVKGFRYAIQQAAAGRVVMSVDCTNLLNLRHLHEKDRGWETAYPEVVEEEPNSNVMSFDHVRRYGTTGKTAIVTYGNGVVTSLQARRYLMEAGDLLNEDALDIIDCPYLSAAPAGLCEIIPRYDAILFADICKQGPSTAPLSSLVTSLQQDGRLPVHWHFVAAPRTYNPLGNMCTFLNVDDIVEAARKLICSC